MKYPIIRSKSKPEKNENNRTGLYTKIAQPLPICDKDKQIFTPGKHGTSSPDSPTSSDKTDRNYFNPTHNPFGLFRFSDKNTFHTICRPQPNKKVPVGIFRPGLQLAFRISGHRCPTRLQLSNDRCGRRFIITMPSTGPLVICLKILLECFDLC